MMGGGLTASFLCVHPKGRKQAILPPRPREMARSYLGLRAIVAQAVACPEFRAAQGTRTSNVSSTLPIR